MGTPSPPTPVRGFLGFELAPRGLGTVKLTGIDSFSAHQISVNSVVAITVSAVSLCPTLVACYWFTRMKRSFRHNLIMMLLVSDIFRTLWYLIHPAIMLSRGTIKSTSKYCQASGFLLAVSTEASDFAVLVIALHPALFIITSRKTVGTGGLYPYRYAVYTFWIVVPVLAGALAFINPSGAYVSTGTFCYLPVRPFWYRLGLAWIPRYFILSMICLIYASIFIYVQIKFRGISDLRGNSLEPSSMLGSSGKDGPDDTSWIQQKRTPSSPKLQKHGLLPESEDAGWAPQRNTTLPPKLQKHGLLPESDDGSSFLNPESPRKHSAGKDSLGPESPRKHSTGRSSLNHETPRKHSTGKSSLTHHSPRKYSVGNPAFEATSMRRFSAGTSTLNYGRTRQQSGASFNSPKRSSIRGSRAAEIESFRQANIIGDIPDQNFRIQQPSRSDANLKDTINVSLVATHTAIRRQLRFMFIYPLVYLILWILPFIAHCLSYSDHYVRHPVYPLSLLNIIILSLRGLVDSSIFCWREKPWRRLPNQKTQRRLRNLRRKSAWQRWWIARVAWWRSMSDHGSSRNSSNPNADVTNSTIEMEIQAPRPSPAPMWWEAEGRMRRDSVWMGTDQDATEESDRRKSKETGKASNALVEVDERGVDEGDETFAKRGLRAVQRSEEEGTVLVRE